MTEGEGTTTSLPLLTTFSVVTTWAHTNVVLITTQYQLGHWIRNHLHPSAPINIFIQNFVLFMYYNVLLLHFYLKLQ